MKVSVLLLSFNRPDLLERALKSILMQEIEDMEILICDDKSDDKYQHRIRALQLLDPRIKVYINDVNLGAFKNLNHAIEIARGDYILMFNDDDVMLPGMLVKEVQFVNQYPNVGFVYTDGYTISPSGKRTLRSCPTPDILKAGIEALNHVVFQFNIFATCVLVRRECYEKLGRWTDTVSADIEMWARIAQYYDIGHINEPLIDVHIHKVSTRSPVSRYENDWLLINKMIASYFPKENQAEISKILKGTPEGYWSIGMQLWQQGDWLKGLEFMNTGRKYVDNSWSWYRRFLSYLLLAVPRRVKYKMTVKERYESYV